MRPRETADSHRRSFRPPSCSGCTSASSRRSTPSGSAASSRRRGRTAGIGPGKRRAGRVITPVTPRRPGRKKFSHTAAILFPVPELLSILRYRPHGLPDCSRFPRSLECMRGELQPSNHRVERAGRRSRSRARQGPRDRGGHQGLARRSRAPDHPHPPHRVLDRQGAGDRTGLVEVRSALRAGTARRRSRESDELRRQLADPRREGCAALGERPRARRTRAPRTEETVAQEGRGGTDAR